MLFWNNVLFAAYGFPKLYHFYSTKIKIHFQDESKQECIQIPFDESEIKKLKDLDHRSNRGIIYHIKGTFSASNFFIFACKNDVGPHFKESFYVENILNGTVCGNKKNQKIKILNIRNNTDVDQNDDDVLNNTIAQNNNTLPGNSTLDDDNDQNNFNCTLDDDNDQNNFNCTLDDDNDQNNFQDDGIQSLLYLRPFGDDKFWFKIALLMSAITFVLMIGNIAYCLKRLI